MVISHDAHYVDVGRDVAQVETDDGDSRLALMTGDDRVGSDVAADITMRAQTRGHRRSPKTTSTTTTETANNRPADQPTDQPPLDPNAYVKLDQRPRPQRMGQKLKLPKKCTGCVVQNSESFLVGRLLLVVLSCRIFFHLVSKAILVRGGR